jgi:peptide methionine sulfoxide reductase MsrB
MTKKEKFTKTELKVENEVRTEERFTEALDRAAAAGLAQEDLDRLKARAYNDRAHILARVEIWPKSGVASHGP